VTVSVALQKLNSDSTILRFEVRDTGIGISRANLDRVFQPFVQADGSTTRKYGGTGLGLAICAKLVTLMNGNIGVVSSLGLGSTFHFTARFEHPRSEPDQSGATRQDLCSPAQDANMPLPASETTDQADREQVRILVVEDVMVNQLVMRRQLEKLGYTNVGNAENGLEALETLARTTYDIVLMDCEMPVLDGREATIRFRRNEQGQRRTPVIAITAKALADDREKCVAAGMDDYISKPIRLEELAGVLDRWRPKVEKAVENRG
jgi:CheY-like chemotaxis protein